MDSAAPVAGSGLMNQVATWTATTMRIAFEQRKIFIFHVGSKDPIEVDFFNVVDIAKGFRGVPQETHIANFPRGKSATFLATLFIHTKGRKKLPVQIAGGDDFRESVQRLKEILEARTIFEDKYRLHGFEDVIRDAILPFAFVASPYPVILSLEVHCDDRQQDEMAAILVRHLKGYLHMEQPSVETTALPSPNSLKEKILIKAKRKKDTTAEMEQQAEEDDLDEPSSEDEISRPEKLQQDMSEYHDMNTSSFPVALNYQTPGKPMVLNRSLFQLNGNCGYVLKPYKLLSTEHQRRARTPNPESLTLELRVISAQFIPTAPGVEPVIQQKGGLKPYLKAEVSSGNAKTETRITALGSGNNPMWNESFVFNIPYLDLSFLILRVKHQKMGPGKNPVLAQAAIHLKAVRNGNNPMWNESFVFNIPYLDLSFLILRVKHQKMGPGKNPVLAQAAIHLKAVRNATFPTDVPMTRLDTAGSATGWERSGDNGFSFQVLDIKHGVSCQLNHQHLNDQKNLNHHIA
ncbi:unnamed protein product [Cyprideis torosa]|uniref:Phosphoinositide phospholipase C n=1 Tax=Cyprideis torosa TaxID=163714 RepID=A0A7R8ZR83_9CRUS|nr:unnamed protein product [Cyprideis torosa]CAG0892398.1 unnamed protein product [Cyprideis torosa]